jgi:transposase
MYSKDIKEKALAYREKHTQKETCETFGISASALKTWRKQVKTTGTLEPPPKRRRWRKIDPGELLLDIHENPDAFNHERAEKFNCTGEAVRQAMKKLKITRKKNSKLYRT